MNAIIAVCVVAVVVLLWIAISLSEISFRLRNRVISVQDVGRLVYSEHLGEKLRK